jgi:N-acetylmuramoyl-L-alanine amidase
VVRVVKRLVRRSAAFAALGVIVGIVAAASIAIGAGEAEITAVTEQRNGNVLELHFELRGDPRLRTSGHGSELLIDLGRTRLAIPERPLLGDEAAPLSALRAIEGSDGNSKLIIEVSGKSDYALARIPGEIVIRLAPAGSVPHLDAPLIASRQSVAPTSQIPANPAPISRSLPVAAVQTAGVRAGSLERIIGTARVVIDPGHGGHDPGTRDSSGRLIERDLALAIALLTAHALEARGVSVAMTRADDTFLSLPQRTQLANRDGADLFVSIHLNWSPNPATRGIEVYYLNNTTDRAALRLARIENGAGASAAYGASGEPNLNYILSDLRQNDKAAESASLARMIDAQTVAELDDSLKLGVNALGAKMGPFYVLVGAQMPAVLVECGFLSNAIEAARLAAPAYQAQLADGIAAAVVRYLNTDLAVGNL